MRTSHIAIIAALAATGAHAQEVAQAQNEWFLAGEATIAEILAQQPNTGRARNVILFTADGNGVGTNYATRLWVGQQAGGLGDDYVLPQEAFPNMALVKTYSTNGQTPDSAPTATAMNTGVKTKNDIINIADNVAVGDCAAGLDPANMLTPFAQIASDMGKSVGVVTTTRITHATPAAVYSATVNRDWEDDSFIPEGCAQLDIADQLVQAMSSGVIDLAMGGGRTHFLPEDVTDEEGEAGSRTDGRNLVDEITAIGGQYAWDTETFLALTAGGNAPVLGLFESSHMPYEADRANEPSLAEMTAAAITRLDQNPEGYYVSIEGGRVDQANHAGNLYRTVTDGEAFADAVQMAIDMTDPAETLIIVTADHEHAIAFNGYCGRGTPINGLCMEIDEAGTVNTGEPTTAADGMPYTVAGYLNGAGSVRTPESEVDEDDSTPLPAFSGTRPMLTQEEATAPDYLQQALIPMGSETHSGEDVAAYASGPWSHLISGTIEQNVIFHVMNYAVNGGMDEAGAEGTTADDEASDAADAAEGLPAEATGEALEDAAEGATAP